jgi:hypothetical protein
LCGLTVRNNSYPTLYPMPLYLPYRLGSIHVVITILAKASVKEDVNTCFITPVPFVNSYLFF